jgi:nucleoside-diphosphate-sugar epimerase
VRVLVTGAAGFLGSHLWHLTGQPTCEFARTMLGWEPRVQLREGLERTIDYHRLRLARDARGAADSDQGVSCAEALS